MNVIKSVKTRIGISKNLEPYLTTHIKSRFRWISALNVIGKIVHDFSECGTWP